MTSKKTRSPLRDQPSRQAGTSTTIQGQLTLIPVFYWLVLAVMLFGIAMGLVWARFVGYATLTLTIVVVAFCISVLGCFLQHRRHRRDFERYAIGASGERAVADALEQLRTDGYHIFHDLPGEREGDANVDHLLIGPGGVFVIETKTRSKPVDGAKDAVVAYDGDTLKVNGSLDNKPIDQVRMLTRDIRGRLARRTGYAPEAIPMRPVVVFPGWYVKGRAKRGHDVWVLNHSALIKWIRSETAKLSTEDASLLASRIDESVRTPTH